MTVVTQRPSTSKKRAATSLESDMIHPGRKLDMAETPLLTKPEDYAETCSTVGNLPYQCEDGLKGTPMAGGVLAKGGTVWVQPFHRGKKRGGSARYVSAYVDGIGMVSIDSRWLVRDVRSQFQRLAG
jgi:hypothetical protein